MLEARDGVVEFTTDFVDLAKRYSTVDSARKELTKTRRELSRDITKFERRGEREVSKARTRIERELRLRRRELEGRASTVTDVIGGTIKTTGSTIRSTGEQVKQLV